MKTKNIIISALISLTFIAIVAISAPYIKRDEYQTSIYVFGRPSPQPPNLHQSNHVTIGPIGFTANQVCGYNDWSSAVIHLPKKLMSKEFWTGQLDHLKEQALQVALNLTGAIPSMLACNMSPTFCNVLNHNELLAQWEFSHSFNQCEILQNLEDATVVNETLKNCIKSLRVSKGLDASEAREYCLDKKANITKMTLPDNFFNINKLWSAICPNENNDLTTSLISDTPRRVVERYRSTCSWSKEIFKGFTVGAGGRLTHKSTFGITVDSQKHIFAKKIEEDAHSIVKTIHSKYKGSTKTPAQILASEEIQEHFKADSSKFYMRLSPDGSTSVPLVTPQNLFQLMLLVQNDPDAEYGNELSVYKQALNRVSEAASYVHTLDNLSVLLTKTQEQCTSNHDLQNEIAKQNCTALLDQLKTQMQILSQRRQIDESYYKTQAEVSQLVNAELARQRAILEPKPKELPKPLDSAGNLLNSY